MTPSLLLCTSYDSLPAASEKYPDLDAHVSALRQAGATVLFGIDATRLEDHKEVREFCGMSSKGQGKEALEDGTVAGFDKIVFNFPHVGASTSQTSLSLSVEQSSRVHTR